MKYMRNILANYPMYEQRLMAVLISVALGILSGVLVSLAWKIAYVARAVPFAELTKAQIFEPLILLLFALIAGWFAKFSWETRNH